MIDENEIVEMKWSTSNLKWYQDKGYKYTKTGDTFLVRVGDLPHGSGAIITETCDVCGKQYSTIYRDYYKRHQHNPLDVCFDCKGIKTSATKSEQNREGTWEKLNDFCDSKGYTLITPKEDIKNLQSKVDYICPEHGLQHSVVDYMLTGRGCYRCGRERAADKCRFSTDYIDDYISSCGEKWLNKDEYVDITTTNLKIQCTCGRTFTTSFNCFKNMGVRRCPYCVNGKSKYEFNIANFLDAEGIDYQQQKTFPGCIDKKYLLFDFYLPDYNLCIEFDGQQHFDDYFYKNFYEDPQWQLQETQRRDQIKNDYCAENDINLLRIPYWDEKKYKEIILDKLNELKTAI